MENYFKQEHSTIVFLSCYGHAFCNVYSYNMTKQMGTHHESAVFSSVPRLVILKVQDENKQKISKNVMFFLINIMKTMTMAYKDLN